MLPIKYLFQRFSPCGILSAFKGTSQLDTAHAVLCSVARVNKLPGVPYAETNSAPASACPKYGVLTIPATGCI